MADRLFEIPREKLKKLSGLYVCRKRESSSFSLLQTILRWLEREPFLNIRIYSLDENWEKDGTFLLIDYDLHNIQIYMNTLSENLGGLVAVLNRLEFTVDYRFVSTPERVKPALFEHLRFKNIPDSSINSIPCIWYYIDKEKALKFPITILTGIKCLPLQLKHAEKINEFWPHRVPGSIIYVKRLIRLNDNVGAFDNDGNLVAWCLRLPSGSLGLLQVVDSNKRQGLGSLLVRHMSYFIASKDEEVMAPVVIENIASRTMFEKLGFYEIEKVDWFTIKVQS